MKAPRGADKQPHTGLRQRAEQRLEASPHASQPADPQDLRRLVHELQVHRLELEMQNEQLRETQRELELSRERYVDLYDFAPAAYVTIDAVGVVVEANLTGARLLGIERSHLLRKPLSTYVIGKDHGVFFEHVRNCIERGEHGACEVTLRRQDGTELPVQLQSVPFRHAEQGTLCRTVVTSLEALHGAIKALELAREVAETANRAKSQFLSNTSHELRTPMNAILGMTDLALEENLPLAAREYLVIVKESADRLMLLLNDILDLARIEAGPLGLVPVVFGLRALMDDTLNLLRPRAEQKGIRLWIEIEDETPDLLVGDASRIRQIVMNLVSNATKFSERGTIEVRIRVATEWADGLELRIDVADSGVGIPADQLDNVFAPFVQLNRATNREQGGTGLGLAISKSLVSMMGGRIWVDSEPGRGSTFHVTLKLARADESSAASSGRASQRPGSSGGDKPVLAPAARRLHVLVVDDDRVNQKLVGSILTRRGHEVETASCGLDALKLMERKQFHVVVMDVQMPGMTGHEAAVAIRKMGDPASRSVPMIALTANAMAGAKEDCLASGMNDYLSKPIDRTRLIELVERLGSQSGD